MYIYIDYFFGLLGVRRFKLMISTSEVGIISNQTKHAITYIETPFDGYLKKYNFFRPNIYNNIIY